MVLVRHEIENWNKVKITRAKWAIITKMFAIQNRHPGYLLLVSSLANVGLNLHHPAFTKDSA